MGGVHIDEHQPVRVLGEHVNAGELCQCVTERRNFIRDECLAIHRC